MRRPSFIVGLIWQHFLPGKFQHTPTTYLLTGGEFPGKSMQGKWVEQGNTNMFRQPKSKT